ncbi:glycosyltransferase family 39 protein [Cyanobium sp. FACHB-13342]|uniref:glycosyltransferase family 39 protein n=1 Tax=Cyanobium sp. FACHB-13342 TaxID=2692793 RepID=UPI001681B02A|nr:glycosyltransferase family 39 protein [Cyanobium sp. FACHB-13342]MBD2424065.1 glycosyltransferase family 39 protein [Cyanobium sp. FACHB-13342]
MADNQRVEDEKINKFLLKLWAGITVYLMGNAIAQTLVLKTASFDDAEQLLLTQNWSLGYGDQPPLYTYLAKLIFIITGPSLLGLFILKAIIISLLASAFLLIGKELRFRKDQHIASLCGLTLIPQFTWSSQTSLTHSVLATTIASYTLWLLIKLSKNPSRLDYWAWLGVFVAGGMLSKYNFALFLAGLTTGSLLVPRIRSLFTQRGMLVALGSSLILLMPHMAWIASHSDLALSGIRDAKTTNLPAVAWPFIGFGVAFAFLSPFWIAALALIWPERLKLLIAEPSKEPAKALIQRLPLVMVGSILVIITVVTRDVIPRSHWFQCLLFFTPISAASLLPSIPKTRAKWLTATALAGAAATTAIMVGGIALAGITGKSRVRNQPTSELISSLRKSYQAPDLIVTDSIFLAGNARLAFPETTVLDLPKEEGQAQENIANHKTLKGKNQRILIVAATEEDLREIENRVIRLDPSLHQLSHDSKTSQYYWAPSKELTLFFAWLSNSS